MNKKIYIKEWSFFKPYSKQTTTDIYYLKLSNEVKRNISPLCYNELSKFLSSKEINALCCFLVSYFEDQISETNLWNSFISLHKKKYGKPLPFFDTSEYIEKEINHQDVAFLIWYFINCLDRDSFLESNHPLIMLLANEVMIVLEEEYEYAPENTLLQSYYRLSIINEDDAYYEVKKFCETILLKSYLFFPDTLYRYTEQKISIIENDSIDSRYKPQVLYDAIDGIINESKTALLSISGDEWILEIIGVSHPLYQDICKLPRKIRGMFFYKGADEKTIFTQHIASGKMFNLTKKSFSKDNYPKEIDDILYFGMSFWKEEWWLSGSFLSYQYDQKIVDQEKKSLIEINKVNSLNPEIKKQNIETLKKMQESFLEFNNNSLIVFLPSGALDSFHKKFISFHNDRLNNKIDPNQKYSFEPGKTATDERALLFFNPNGGIEYGFDINSAFPTSENPFYDPETEEEDFKYLLMDSNLSTELALYAIENYGDHIQYLKTQNGKKILEDIDFLLRFWKCDYYETKPAITVL
ncbi:DUF3843 family protein [Aquimarina sp. RZ0]|uniref:DUF3843 family protein n=1 Tax=Aquimarina sp. RZ0 TaxID=2607730 RepID=UPI00165FE84F|nr:DUF3843 family protein [Aquimarina sp. RZ0]